MAEYKRAKRQVKQLEDAFPDAEWLVGNHDCLPGRKATTAGLPDVVIKDFNATWEIGWKVHERFSKLKIDGVIYAHGEHGGGRGTGNGQAIKQAKENFRSMVIGHFHAQAGTSFWANSEFRVFGMSVGCGMDATKLQFEYGRKFSAKPILGCGVVVDGKRAIFEPWLLKSR